MKIKQLLEVEMIKYNETWNDVEASTISNDNLNLEARENYYSISIFNIWTKNRIYFSTTYDDMPGIDSISRNPTEIPREINCDYVNEHQYVKEIKYESNIPMDQWNKTEMTLFREAKKIALEKMNKNI